ncbi:MAG: hypothetical protein HUJ56_10335, partial [Erysipelotrichaceae bacterium]|nr:hypothetical protein [Erysipelotrichaceae bacterium]
GNNYKNFDGSSDADRMQKAIQNACNYKKSAEKIAMMVQRFEEDGFTSYWL